MRQQTLSFLDSGSLSYAEGRRLQQQLVEERIAGKRSDTFLLCEHPPTYTFGRSAKDHSAALKTDPPAELVNVDRGGGATFHGPGQLVIYPVVLLPELGFGVKRFVALVLTAIAETVSSFGLAAAPCMNPLGVWIVRPDESRGKVASAGLRITKGATLHGFSLNYACDLSYFKAIAPCGLPPAVVTSLSSELCRPVQRLEVEEKLRNRLSGLWPFANRC